MCLTLCTLYCEDDIRVMGGHAVAIFYRFTFGLGIVIYYCEMLFVHLVFADRSVLVDNRLLSTA